MKRGLRRIYGMNRSFGRLLFRNHWTKNAEPHTANPPPNGASADIESHLARSEQPKLAVERLESAPEFRNAPASMSSSPPEVRHVQIRSSHREGHERLQELYLTDEPLDGAKIADLVFQLPRVTGVAIMLSDGAILGAELGGGISEKLLGLAPDFLKHVSGLTEMIPGGPTRSSHFSGWIADQLVIDGDVLMLNGHEGKITSGPPRTAHRDDASLKRLLWSLAVRHGRGPRYITNDSTDRSMSEKC